MPAAEFRGGLFLYVYVILTATSPSKNALIISFLSNKISYLSTCFTRIILQPIDFSRKNGYNLWEKKIFGR